MAYDFGPFDKEIKETEEWLAREFTSIRTGRASPALLDSVKVDAYGSRTPINQIGSVTIEDARTIRITPWDKSLIKPIEKAILEADLGVSSSVDDQGLRVFFPELTAERRTMLLKLADEKLEQAKITLRGHRAETIKYIESSEKDGGVSKDEIFRLKEDVQKRVDGGIEALEALGKKKHSEISS
jgi:ribosome recycling factor